MDYLAACRQKGLCREDFERARRVEYAEFIKSFDSTEEIANTLLSFAVEGVDIFSYADVLQGLQFEDVARFFHEVFDPSRITLSVIYPKE